MNCIYEMNGSEQEMRAAPQYHTNGYATLASPYAPASMVKLESSQTMANNSSDSIKQSSELLMVSINHSIALSVSNHYSVDGLIACC